MHRRFAKIACSLSLTIFSTFSVHSFAAEEVYKVEQTGYLNSVDGAIEASCRPGDQLVKSLCYDRLDAIGVPPGERMPFPALKDSETAVQDAHLKAETTPQSVRCQAEKLRADQRIRMIAVAHCKASQS
jgi:hypothetical protein